MIIQQKQFVKTIYDFVYIATWIKHRSCDRFNRTLSTKFSGIHKNYNWDKYIELLMIVTASLRLEWWFVIANLAKLHSYTCLANLHNCFGDKKRGMKYFFFLNTVNALYSTQYQLEKKHEAASNQNYQFWKIRIF